MTELEMISTKYGRIKYVAGQRIGNAVFVGEIYSENDRKALFVCECGKLFTAWIHSVKSNVTKSCGCYRKKYMTDKKTTHGMSRSPFYNLYNNIIERCYNQNNKSYKTYGGKGVTVCKEWRDSFLVFCDWCKDNGWAAGLQIDKDINGISRLKIFYQ